MVQVKDSSELGMSALSRPWPSVCQSVSFPPDLITTTVPVPPAASQQQLGVGSVATRSHFIGSSQLHGWNMTWSHISSYTELDSWISEWFTAAGRWMCSGRSSGRSRNTEKCVRRRQRVGFIGLKKTTSATLREKTNVDAEIVCFSLKLVSGHFRLLQSSLIHFSQTADCQIPTIV